MLELIFACIYMTYLPLFYNAVKNPWTLCNAARRSYRAAIANSLVMYRRKGSVLR
ncbi:hypothetical protein BDW75DRAFT_225425 [Aspergillus navahoensis]